MTFFIHVNLYLFFWHYPNSSDSMYVSRQVTKYACIADIAQEVTLSVILIRMTSVYLRHRRGEHSLRHDQYTPVTPSKSQHTHILSCLPYTSLASFWPPDRFISISLHLHHTRELSWGHRTTRVHVSLKVSTWCLTLSSCTLHLHSLIQFLPVNNLLIKNIINEYYLLDDHSCCWVHVEYVKLN